MHARSRTPEGTNISLISSLGIYGGVDEAFLVTPYREIKHGHRTEHVVWMRANEESEAYLAPADADMDEKGKLTGPQVIARYQTDFHTISVDQVQFMDISPKQMVGVSAGLIPFLEHDDANRALMNLEHAAPGCALAGGRARRSSPRVLKSRRDGWGDRQGPGRRRRDVCRRDSHSDRQRPADQAPQVRRPQRADLLNKKPVVGVGQKIRRETSWPTAAPSTASWPWAATSWSEFMAWDGYNFEDAIIISERLVRRRLHVDPHPKGVRDRDPRDQAGTRGVHRQHSQRLGEGSWNLDENGIVRIGTYVKPGDILVGKVAPQEQERADPEEEKLLHAIFGRAGEDVKNDSLEVPSGVEGIVINTQRFSRRIQRRRA